MTKLYRIFKAQIVMAVVLFGATLSFAQPVIKVPPLCEVVVAGTGVGAATGFGGKVGNGGIVIMPDSFDLASPSGDFVIIPNGSTGYKWNLFGDISGTTSNTPPLAGIYNVTGSTINIESYNKSLRPSEGSATALERLRARSKGRVIVSYSAVPCDGSITFNIFKKYAPDVVLNPLNPLLQPTNVPKIIGTSCLLPNTQYTCSIDQIASDNANDAIGFDSYYWSGLPSGYIPIAGNTSNYSSADFSSITFRTGAVITPFTLKCCIGRANNTYDLGVSSITTASNAAATCVSLDIKPAPVPPQITATTNISSTTTLNSSTRTGCVNTGLTSFTIKYSNIPVGTTYTWVPVNSAWTVATNTTITPGSTIVTFSGLDNNPEQVKLTVNNGVCTPADFIYQINRTLVVPLAAIPTVNELVISPANTCVLAGSTTSFSINGLSNGTTYTLSPALAGFIITPSTIGSTASVFLPTTAAGTYTLTATGKTTGTNPTCGGAITTKIYIKPLAPTGLTGSTCVTRNGGSPVTYTCNASVGATGYVWSFPSGWVAGNATVTTILPTYTITPNGNTGGGNVSVNAIGVTTANPVCNSATTTLAINYAIPTPAITVATNNCYNVGMASTIRINITNPPAPFFGSYTVTMTPTGDTTPNYTVASSVFFNGTTNVLTFNTIDTLDNLLLPVPTGLVSPPSGVYDVKVTFDAGTTGSSCASTAFAIVQITIPPASTATKGFNFSPGVGNADSYFVNSAPVPSSYAWFFNTTQINSALSSALTLNGNSSLQGIVSAIVTTAASTVGACPSVTRLIWTPSGTHTVNRTANTTDLTTKVKGVLVYPNPTKGDFTIEVDRIKTSGMVLLSDVNGKEIGIYLLKEGVNNIGNDGLAKGIYTLLLEVDGVNEVRKIIIE